MKNIVVIGAGYVGLSNAILLSQKNNVVIIDILEDKVKNINNRVSPIKDSYIEKFFLEKELKLKASVNGNKYYKDADFIIIATPTNYDEYKDYFDTSSIEDVLEQVYTSETDATVIIKSTIPIGYTDKLKNKYKDLEIIFSPEFLREGSALYDNLYPSRIVIGSKSKNATVFSSLLKDSAIKKDIDILYTESKEAESIKLFANTYLAMRVAFFNELDTFCEIKGIDTKSVIEGVSLDSRIGKGYNNPSFGYGGYCLPKDSKQLLASCKEIPNSIIESVVESNEIRKNHIIQEILKKSPKRVGVYKLAMKSGSDNFRSSAIFDIVDGLINYGVDTWIYEPGLKTLKNYRICNDLDKVKQECDLIITNRLDEELNDVMYKVYTRDIYTRD